jgi:Zn-dependent peptidase ImmA (M78 family)
MSFPYTRKFILPIGLKPEAAAATQLVIASFILMPENLIRSQVESFKTKKNIKSLTNHASEIIYQLSKEFNVSTSSVIKRLKSLGYISGWIWI